MDRLIRPEPSNSVVIRIEPGRKCCGKLTLRNLMYTMPVAFKLQPMDRARFTVKPQSGIISPLASLTVEVTYNHPAQGLSLPGSFARSDLDSFLLHSVVVPGASIKEPASMLDSVPGDWFTAKKKQVFIDSGLRVMFAGSPVLAQLVKGGGSVDQLREVLERSDPEWKAADSVDAAEGGQTLLHLAIARGRADIIQLLLEFRPDVEAQDSSGSTPLEASSASGEALIVELLLSRGANTERSNNNNLGLDPAHLAAQYGHLEVLRLLLQNGANVNALTRDGATALHLAVAGRRRDCVRLLLASGADPSVHNSEDRDTPLHIAARSGDEGAVKILIQKGAEKYARNRRGETPYDLAAENGHGRLFDVLRQGAVLALAARKGEARAVRMVIEDGAAVNGQDQRGWTALHRAAFKGHVETVSVLLDNGADVGAKDGEGYTALHCAVESGHVEVVEVLVKKGADVDGRTGKGVSPLQVAESMGHDGIAGLLVQNGASNERSRSTVEGMDGPISILGRMAAARGKKSGEAKVKQTLSRHRKSNSRGSFGRSIAPVSAV